VPHSLTPVTAPDGRVRAVLAGAVLLALVGVVIVGALLARSASGRALQAVRLDDSLQQAALAVVSEESSERKYLLEPGPEAEGAHTAAEHDLQRALATFVAHGDAAEQRFGDATLKDNARYVRASRALFAARDRSAGRPELERVDTEQVDPVFSRLEASVTAAADRQHRAALAAVRSGRRTGTVVVVLDVLTLLLALLTTGLTSRRVVRAQAELQAQNRANAHQALHDALTGLPNRTLLQDRAGHALALRRRSRQGVAVLLLDLDRFKEVNDTLGHHAGDDLLVQVGRRLVDTARGSDTVARLGGDEFAVLLEGVDEAEAVVAAGRLCAALGETFSVDGVALDLEASIGVVLADGEDEDVNRLLQRADVAMYQAKEHHLGVAVYDAARDVNTPLRLALLGDLRRALSREDELFLHYQPKIASGTGRVCGVEALLRWAHPERGLVPPDQFIPVVETTGLVDGLTTHVLHLALRQQRDWLDRGFDLPVAVNISARSLLDAAFPEAVVALLAEHRVPAGQLVLELTESTVMSDPVAAVAILQRLQDAGVQVALDDFGTGYSSMAYLKKLPVAELKIDRSFVTHLPDDGENLVLVQSAIDLGHNLGLTVVAEGVEDEATLEQLRAMGCDLAQGFHISRPVPARDLERWLEQAPASAPVLQG
jgi:diguanylate cyclase (GGDEF)-like protein